MSKRVPVEKNTSCCPAGFSTVFLTYGGDWMKKISRYLSTTNGLVRDYGWDGLWKGILNKLRGRDLVYGLHLRNTIHASAQDQPVSAPDVGGQILNDQQDELTREEQRQCIENLSLQPLISVIMPIYQPQIKWLEVALHSLQRQTYKNWELCAVDDGSPSEVGVSTIKAFAKKDSRIRLQCCKKNGGISAASNVALKMAKGPYIALMDQDDELTQDALYRMVETLNEHPDADCIYSDECRVDMDSQNPHYSHFFFKPEWSPEMMLNFMYIGHLTVYRRELIDELGGFRSKYDFSQDYDLALRVGGITNNIYHVERVLYFWRMLESSGASGGKDYALRTQLLALTDYLKSQKYDGSVQCGDYGRYPVAQRSYLPKISIIVPSDNEKNLRLLLKTLLTHTAYCNVELVLVLNSGLAEKIGVDYVHMGDQLKLCRYDECFNFSDKCNKGVEMATGNVVVFLNDDAAPNQADWLERMMDVLYLPNVGGVSPAMIYPDGCSIQYAGINAGQKVCGLFGPSFHMKNWNSCEQIVNQRLIRDVYVLSGACMMMQKSIFLSIGGFDAVNTPNGHSDVDLSLRLHERGLRCVYTPYSVLTHPGNGSWVPSSRGDKANIYLIQRYGTELCHDPYFTWSMRCYSENNEKPSFDFQFPANANSSTGRGNILLVSHELSRTGAPVVFLQMAELLKEAGYFVVVISPDYGPLREKFLSAGIPSIVDSSIANYRMYSPDKVPDKVSYALDGMIYDFDLVICNTMVTHNIINCYSKTSVPILWWLHEGKVSLELFSSSLPKKIPDNVSVYCVGKYVQEQLKKFGVSYPTKELLYGIKDYSGQSCEVSTKKVRFVFPGSFEIRKNQSLLIDAVKLLPREIAGKAEFIMVGNYWDEVLYNSLKKKSESIENIKFMNSIPYDELMELYRSMTCMVVPSIDDPMPVVLTEAMMLSKLVLCSNGTGTSRYIEDGVNGFVFDYHNPEELCKKMTYIIENAGDQALTDIAKEGRKVYENHFTEDAFRKNLLDAVEYEMKREF